MSNPRAESRINTTDRRAGEIARIMKILIKYQYLIFLNLACVGLFVAAISAAEPVAGDRIAIADDATLFTPRGYKPEGDSVRVFLHLHGAASAVEPALVSKDRRAVLIEFNRKGLSSVYTKPFSDPALFPRLLDSAMRALREKRISKEPKPSEVIVCSFSAGFGGVREMLKDPGAFERIDAIVLADSLYAGYLGDIKKRVIDPEAMEGFVRFAREAAEGRKAMLISHSEVVPEGYASTAETASYLIKAVGAVETSSEEDWGDGWRRTRTAVKGRFVVLGFSGSEGIDHLRHLRREGELWDRLPPKKRNN